MNPRLGKQAKFYVIYWRRRTKAPKENYIVTLEKKNNVQAQTLFKYLEK